MVSGWGSPSRPSQVDEALLVLRPDGDPVAVGGELVEEGHRGALAAAVDELATRAPAASAERIIAQDRGDADAAGDEQVARGVDEREVVAGPADPDGVAGLELVVDVERPAAAVRVAQDAQPPGVLVGGVAAQGVLAGRGAAEDQVDVRAGLPRRQRWRSVELVQGQRDDALGDDVFAVDADVGLELAGGEGEPGAAVLHRLDVRREALRRADRRRPARSGRT